MQLNQYVTNREFSNVQFDDEHTICIAISTCYLFMGKVDLRALKYKKLNYSDKKQSSSVMVYEFNKSIIFTYSGLVLIFLLTFIFPTYANAKYFYFLTPFLLIRCLLLNVYPVSQILILLFSLGASLVTLAHLSAYLL